MQQGGARKSESGISSGAPEMACASGAGLQWATGACSQGQNWVLPAARGPECYTPQGMSCMSVRTCSGCYFADARLRLGCKEM